MDLAAIQSALRDQHLDGWLFYDHHYRDPLGYRILGLGDGLHVTRRWFYFVPAEGEPKRTSRPALPFVSSSSPVAD